MTCEACTRAAQRASYQFLEGCRGCCARHIGHLPQYREARRLKDQRHRPYVLLLESFGLTHEEVREAVKADVALQRELDASKQNSERLLAAHRARSAADFQRETGGG